MVWTDTIGLLKSLYKDLTETNTEEILNSHTIRKKTRKVSELQMNFVIYFWKDFKSYLKSFLQSYLIKLLNKINLIYLKWYKH